MLNVFIREATVEDAGIVAELSGELGYPVSASEITARLHGYTTDPLHCVLVAELGDEVVGHKVVGWIDISIVSHLQSGPYREIGGLIVANEVRGQNIGSRLVGAAEDWTKARGVSKCLVRSSSTRSDAIRFYEREKYTLEKTSAVLSKKLV